MSEPQKTGCVCFRCKQENVWYDKEQLEDGSKIGLYTCYACRTQWYSVEDIMPYIMKLRLEIRRLGGEQPKPPQPEPAIAGTPQRVDRPL